MEAALNTVAGRLPLSTSLVKIGSSPENQLVLQDPKASPLHAGIRPQELGYSITDLGSASGTFVNGQRLEYNSPRLLYSGDIIRIGDTVFTYELSDTSLAGAVMPGNTDQESSAGVQTAYNQFSPGAQSLSQSEANFAKSFSHGDRVVSCSYSNVRESGNSAMTTVTFTGSSSGTTSLVFTLIQDSSFNWRIDGFK